MKFDKINSEAIYELRYQEDMRAKGIPYQVSNLVIYTAISALEKQIPKKPILDTIFPSGVKWWRCPACRHNNIETNDRFCHNCGQALDWGELNV